MNTTWLIFWLTALLLVLTLNIGLFCFNHFRPFSTRLYLMFLLGLTILYGSLWGVAGSLLIPNNDLLHQMLVVIIIIGVVSGGLHTFQSNLVASLLFFTLTIFPLIFWFFFQETHPHNLLGIALLTYFCFMLMVSWLGYKQLNNNLKLRYENLDLIDKLFSSNTILAESESRFRSAFDFAAIGMALVSLEGRWLKVNKSLCLLIGYTEDELLAIDFQTITYREDLDIDLNYVQQLLAGEIITYQMEKRYIHKNGSIIWVLLSVSLIQDAENKPLYFVSQIQNIDAQKRAEQELKYIAYHDVLTGLANRKQLQASFELALAYAKRHNTMIAIMFLDLDYFKAVNDTLGHDIGDLLLIQIGLRLKALLRSTDISARIGGDEFIVALTELSHIEQAIDVAKKILSALEKPIIIKKHKIEITGSIGISLYPKDGNALETLIKQADKALYIVKSEGRNGFRIFIPEAS